MAERGLPPDVPDEDHALSVLRRSGEEIVAGVGRALPAWAERRVRELLDAWGRHGPEERARLLAEARRAGERAAARVTAELEDLLGRDPGSQTATPLQVVRSVHREVGAVPAGAGVPPVERDEFARRSFPDDDYGLVPDTLAELDEELGPLHLAWGAAKAAVHRARHPRG